MAQRPKQRQQVEISDRLVYWTSPHPNWRPNPEWPEHVGCVLYRGDDALALVDPLIRDDLDPGAWAWLDATVADAKKPVAVLLTAPWHERSTRAVMARYDGRVWGAPVASGRIRDLPQLHVLPRGIDAFVPRGVDEGQLAFVLKEEQAIVVGEFFLGTSSGLVVAPSPASRDVGEFIDSIGELERIPIRRVLVSHGQPIFDGGNEAISAAVRAFRAAS